MDEANETDRMARRTSVLEASLYIGFAVAPILVGIALFLYHGYRWLRFGAWDMVTTLEFISLWHSVEWVGAAEVLDFLPLGVSLILAGITAAYVIYYAIEN